MTSLKECFFPKAEETMSLKVAQMNLMSVNLSIIQAYMFSKDSENFREKIKSNRNGGLETASA